MPSLLDKEWLEADGRGGFASGTAAGIRTRRYHASLLVATTPPTGRMVGFLHRCCCSTWTTRGSATSPKSPMVTRRMRRAAASSKPGQSARRCDSIRLSSPIEYEDRGSRLLCGALRRRRRMSRRSHAWLVRMASHPPRVSSSTLSPTRISPP